MALPQFHTSIRELAMLQSQWASQLDPAVSNPLVNGSLLTNVTLAIGDNTINHLLGRKLVGWIIVGVSAASAIYDKQALNQMPNLTLVLNSSAGCTANIYVF